MHQTTPGKQLLISHFLVSGNYLLISRAHRVLQVFQISENLFSTWLDTIRMPRGFGRPCSGDVVAWRKCGLLQGMLDYMPDLNEIGLGHSDYEDIELEDAAVGTLLSGSHKGWKVVRLWSGFGRAAMDALSKHTPTLELLDIRGCDASLSRHLGQVLSSCANLHSLLSTGYDMYDPPHYCAAIDYKAFIDLDPNTEVPKPWECEGSLKKLKVVITGIPHSDLEEEDNVEGAYPDEGREIHGRVYDRLARFINLETLWLGDYWSSGNFWGIDMSLRSGLGKLSGLKKLREIGGLGWGRGVGVKEVQWMVANWPRLHLVLGLEDDEARAWLKENTDVNVKLE
ncbi:MAG: hypothetical protein J3Q66DRAFT_351084 [Benniella sp.]|nr:MAG: hypothetical protein J3Q66DRAFT_351084 [Benniella sp.]